MYEWLKVAHLISLFLWIGGLFAIYWILRLHVHAPATVHEKLTLMERSIAMATDLACTAAIIAGVGLIFAQTPNLFARPGNGWLHIKLTVVLLGLLPMHGMLRAKIKRFGQGKITPIGNWIWTVILVSITIITIMVIRGPAMFAKPVPTSAAIQPTPPTMDPAPAPR
ncbi:MAG: CopD family protein [Proteobacteria bacterium]|nr:CopD family protein [Pseudomonadota bacterium]